MINKILVINPFGIGDVLFSTPLLKAIKKRYPEAVIAYMCNKRTAGILKNDPNISALYIFEKDEYRKAWEESRIKCLMKVGSLIKSIRIQRYDVLVDMSLAYIYSLILSIFAKIPVRIGFNYRERGKFLTHRIDIHGFDKSMSSNIISNWVRRSALTLKIKKWVSQWQKRIRNGRISFWSLTTY